jgi:hypothetical protein
MKKILLPALWLALVGFHPAAGAAPACNEDWGDLESFELDGSDLALHSKAPGEGEAWGKASCIFWSDENLMDFRLASEREFRETVEKNFAAHRKYGQFDAADLICRFEDTRSLAAEASFEKPDGNSALHKVLLQKVCSGMTKRNHYAFVELPLRAAAVKMRCGPKEKMQEWERQCGGREPSSVKVKAKGKAKKAAKKK